jgi:hypothetical protein
MGEIFAMPRWVKVLRWVARIWSLIVAIVIIMIAVTPDPNSTGQVSSSEIFYLSLYAVSAFGLLLAWKWELLGSIISLLAVITQAISVIIGKGFNFYLKIAIIQLVFIIPAIVFIVCWQFSRIKPTKN